MLTANLNVAKINAAVPFIKGHHSELTSTFGDCFYTKCTFCHKHQDTTASLVCIKTPFKISPQFYRTNIYDLKI